MRAARTHAFPPSQSFARAAPPGFPVTMRRELAAETRSASLSPIMARPPRRRRVRICYFNAWATGLEEAAAYVARVPALDLRPLVSNPRDADLLAKARLDCDWYAENTRAFAAVEDERLELLPAWVCGRSGILDLARAPGAGTEERWLVAMGHQPQALGAAAGGTYRLLARCGVRHLFYSFDEASRALPCFNDIAPHLDVLIHDEQPLAPAGRRLLRANCRTLHRSWVANLRPYQVPFNERPEERILFLGSQLGLTAHRRRQIAFLQEAFGDRFVAIHDHSVSVADRAALSRFKVGFCPEGRKFGSPAMAGTHTDRPFWSGCSGIVPVTEDSSAGGRLEELARAGLVFRYPHGDLAALKGACERALGADAAVRRGIYEHFNRRETVGTVVGEAIGAAIPASENAKAPDGAGALLELAKPGPQGASAG